MHPIFGDIFRTMGYTEPPVPTIDCATCGEALTGYARQLPSYLQPVFPQDANAFWCSLECLQAWIEDRAMFLAADATMEEVDA